MLIFYFFVSLLFSCACFCYLIIILVIIIIFYALKRHRLGKLSIILFIGFLSNIEHVFICLLSVARFAGFDCFIAYKDLVHPLIDDLILCLIMYLDFNQHYYYFIFTFYRPYAHH